MKEMNLNSPKVFEYAKQIGMETLGLMDKLREWNISVKSHMAELNDDTIKLIETKLAEAEVAKKTAPKKVVKAVKAPKEKAVEAPKAKKAAAKVAAKPTPPQRPRAEDRS